MDIVLLCYALFWPWSLQWRHNGRGCVSNHQPRDCLLKRLFRLRSKKTSKLHVTGLYAGNSPVPVNSPHKWPVTRKIFPFDDVIMHQLKMIHGFYSPNRTCMIMPVTQPWRIRVKSTLYPTTASTNNMYHLMANRLVLIYRRIKMVFINESCHFCGICWNYSCTPPSFSSSGN